jgi:hypothetical protein
MLWCHRTVPHSPVEPTRPCAIHLVPSPVPPPLPGVDWPENALPVIDAPWGGWTPCRLSSGGRGCHTGGPVRIILQNAWGQQPHQRMPGRRRGALMCCKRETPSRQASVAPLCPIEPPRSVAASRWTPTRQVGGHHQGGQRARLACRDETVDLPRGLIYTWRETTVPNAVACRTGALIR